MTKVEMSKNIHLQMWFPTSSRAPLFWTPLMSALPKPEGSMSATHFKLMSFEQSWWFLFHIWSGKLFISLDTILQCLSLSKNIFQIKWQKVFTFANGHFCHFNVCHNRINSFWFRIFYWAINLYKQHFNTILKQMDMRSFLCFLDQKRSQEHSVSICTCPHLLLLKKFSLPADSLWEKLF